MKKIVKVVTLACTVVVLAALASIGWSLGYYIMAFSLFETVGF